MENFIREAIFFLPVFLLAISFHESSHGYIANRFGDPTAKDMGRITLNPLPHIDPVGLIAIFIPPHFGWAKPVPVNPYNLRNPIKDNLWIALAGPASNLILAIISAIVFRIVAPFLQFSAAGGFILTMILLSVSLNLVLMTFNLFPIPPLDGFHILEGLVSTEMYIKLQRLEQIGPIILLIIIMASNFGHLNFFGAIFSPVVRTLGGLLLGRPVGW